MSETKRRRRWPYVAGGVIVVLGVAILAFRWDWLIPIIDPRVSAALGRDVRMSHLHVTLGRVTHVVVDDLAIANPSGWAGGGDFATAEHLVVDFDVGRFLHDRSIVLPSITIDRPHVEAAQMQDGTANWTLASGNNDSSGGGAAPDIGQLVINDGTAHVKTEKLRGDFNVEIATRAAQDGKDQIVARARGTYAQQPIVAEFVGGALLSLRDASDPYPVDLKLTNGPTTMSAVGSIQNPLAFAGANVTLELAGPDMALLLPLTGIAIPKTPPYRIAGKLDYQSGVVKFTGVSGKVGSSDLEGDFNVDTKPHRPVLVADLRSRMVDLKDLAGFIGAEPGDADKGTKKPAPTRSTGKVLPDEPLSVPRLNAADVHLNYRAGRIEGRRQPLDNMLVQLDIVDGAIDLHPLSFGIGTGKIVANIGLRPDRDALATKADIDFERVDVSRLMSATGIGQGAGSIGGRASIVGTGKSVAQILASGNGELRLYMGAGGNLSALLIDISGLQFGNALLSALGVPDRTKVECLVTDFVLKDGAASSRLTMLDTDQNRLGITGGVNLRTEAISFNLRTEAKHFSVGSLPTDIGIVGTLGAPSIDPHLAEVGTRAAAAVGLGVFLTPLAALLPTIQTGIGDDHACSGLLREVQAPPRVPAQPPAPRAARRTR